MPTRKELMSLLSGEGTFTPKRPRKKMRATAEPYPDFGKSIVSQGETDPTRAGLLRGTQTGALGAVLGALIARMASDSNFDTGAGALAGAAIGGIPGYISGKRQSESDKTRLLALRRLGIETPGEYQFSQSFPLLSKGIASEGYKV